MSPKGDILGQQISEETLRDVSREINSSIEPKIYPTILKETLENKIYEIIKSNPRITRNKLAIQISKNERTIQRALNSLKEKDMIERVGNNMSGYWKIVK